MWWIVNNGIMFNNTNKNEENKGKGKGKETKRNKKQKKAKTNNMNKEIIIQWKQTKKKNNRKIHVKQ